MDSCFTYFYFLADSRDGRRTGKCVWREVTGGLVIMKSEILISFILNAGNDPIKEDLDEDIS